MGPWTWLALQLVAAAGAAPPQRMQAVPMTVDCSRDDAAGVSRDCGRLLEDVFDALLPHSGVPHSKRLYLPDYYGVSTNCTNNGSAFESSSPAAADDCGGDTDPFVVFGYSVFSLVGPCVDESGGDAGGGVAAGLAFVAGHELAHVKMGHAKARRDRLEVLCDAWIKGLKERDLRKKIGGLVRKMRRNGDGPRAIKQAAITRLVELCLEEPHVVEDISRFSQPLEFDADAEGKAIVLKSKLFGDASERAGECVMLRLHELEKSDRHGFVPAGKGRAAATRVSDHPDALARAEKLRQLSEMMCAGGVPTAVCDPQLPSDDE